MNQSPHPTEVSASDSGDQKLVPITVAEFAQRLGSIVGSCLAEQSNGTDSALRNVPPTPSH